MAPPQRKYQYRPSSRRKPATSQFLGVSFRGYKKRGQPKWEAHIYHGGKFIYLGTFPTEEAAARARDREARVLNPLLALNFP